MWPFKSRSKPQQGPSRADLFVVGYYQHRMDDFFRREGLSIEGLPTENQIRAYAVICTSGIYQMARAKAGADGTPFRHRVALLVVGLQCVHMLYRIAYSGRDTGVGSIGETKGVVIQNVFTDLMETDLDNPSDEAMGVMSTAYLVYRSLSETDRALLVRIDDAWEHLFQERSAAHANALIACIVEVARTLQSQTQTAHVGKL